MTQEQDFIAKRKIQGIFELPTLQELRDYSASELARLSNPASFGNPDIYDKNYAKWQNALLQAKEELFNIEKRLQNQTNQLKANISPNILDQFGNLENPQTKGLLIAGGLALAAIVLSR